MPTFTFTDPNGKKHKVTGPDGSTAEDALAILRSQGIVPPIPQKTLGEKVGEAAADALSDVPDVIKGTLELPTALVTGALGNVAGHIAGAGQYLQNAFTPDRPGKTQPIDVFNKVSDAFTYKPSSVSGAGSVGLVNRGLGATVGQVGEFVGDVSRGMGADPYIEQATRDAATMAASAGMLKGTAVAVPKAVNSVRRVSGAIRDNPIASALIAAEAMGVPGAATLGGAAIIGKAVKQGIKENARRDIAVYEPTPVQKFEGITTRAEAAQRAEDFAQHRTDTLAANRARIEAANDATAKPTIITPEGAEVVDVADVPTTVKRARNPNWRSEMPASMAGRKLVDGYRLGAEDIVDVVPKAPAAVEATPAAVEPAPATVKRARNTDWRNKMPSSMAGKKIKSVTRLDETAPSPAEAMVEKVTAPAEEVSGVGKRLAIIDRQEQLRKTAEADAAAATDPLTKQLYRHSANELYVANRLGKEKVAGEPLDFTVEDMATPGKVKFPHKAEAHDAKVWDEYRAEELRRGSKTASEYGAEKTSRAKHKSNATLMLESQVSKMDDATLLQKADEVMPSINTRVKKPKK